MFVASGGTDGSVVEVRNEATGPAGGPEHSRFIEWTRLPEVQRPVLVAAFEGWNDAGDAATTAVGHLRDRLRAVSFAKIDPEEFFDFTSTRPVVHIEDGRPAASNGRSPSSAPSAAIASAPT